VMARRGASGGAGAAAPAAAAAPAKPSAEPNAPKFFAALDKRLADNKGLAGEVHATVTFKVSDPDATKTFELGGDTQLTITIADGDLPELATGTVRALFQHGKVRIDGDVSVAHRLGFLKGLLDR
jgi:3-hydroxyacyl-CoA dehydrogenase/3a,7a,12a-trihydroxy-5b-cholest-24-enoyl-CoA hydratase